MDNVIRALGVDRSRLGSLEFSEIGQVNSEIGPASGPTPFASAPSNIVPGSLFSSEIALFPLKRHLE